MLIYAALVSFLSFSALDAGFKDSGMMEDSGVVTDSGMMEDSDSGVCEAYCEENTLIYCDQNIHLSEGIDCSALEARCGLLNEDWGYDCILKEGAECFAGYALGASRCDADKNLNCVENECSTKEKGSAEILEAKSIRGTSYQENEQESFLSGCDGCQDQNGSNTAFSLLFGCIGLRGLRRLRKK